MPYFLGKDCMKTVTIAGFILFVLALPLLLFTSGVRYMVNDLRLYHNGFQKYDIPAATGIELTELDRAAKELVEYFNSEEERVHIVLKSGATLFNEKEVSHLEDVKGLIQFAYRLQVGALAYVLGYAAISVVRRRGRRAAWGRLARGAMAGGALTLAVMLVLGVAMLLAFDRVFLAFHLLGFSNLLWILDPATDRLIQMFPQGFFFDAALLLAGVTLAGAMLVGVVGWGGRFYLKRRQAALG